jgi:hypothetical protein
LGTNGARFPFLPQRAVPMAKKDRLEKIRKVRSLNDILDIIKDITKDVNSDGNVVKNLFTSLSARRGGQDEEITIQHTAKRPTRVSTRSKPSGGDLGIQIKDFKAPPKSAIEKHVQVLTRLYDNAKELDAVEAMLRQTFSGVKHQGTALNAVKALQKEVDNSIHTALTALNKVATKHFPTEMEKLRDQLTAFLLDNIPENLYDDMAFLEYASLGDNGEIIFSVYVEIKNLKNGKGYVFDEYFIILTGVVNVKGNISYYINALPDFRVPGKYQLGKQITNAAQMEIQASMLLNHNDVVTDMDRRPLPLSKKDASTRGFGNVPGAGEVEVKDDALYVQILKDDNRTVTNIIKSTMALLNGALGRKRDTSISYKRVTRNGKKWVKFILYFKPDANSANSLNRNKFNEIKDTLDLDDATAERLRRAMLD